MTTVQRLSIAEGDSGTRQTVQRIAELIRSGVALPMVRDTATMIVGQFDPREYGGMMSAIREWCAAHIRFLRDPAGTELLHTPEWILNRIFMTGAAHVDCDDAAILGGALAGSVGFSVSLVTVAFLDKRAPFSHIWVSITPPVPFLGPDGQQQWMELDVTRPMQDVPLDIISRSFVEQVL